MGNISTLALVASYDAIRDDINHLHIRLEGRPLTAALAPPFVALQGDITSVEQQEQHLVFNAARCEVRAVLADEDVDTLVDVLVHAVLVITGNDRKHPLYVHFIGDMTPGKIKEPVNGEELVTAKSWIPSLQSSPHPTLVALAPQLDKAVTAAENREADLAAAELTLKNFREVGPRKALVDKANALRLSTYGALGDIAHSHPELNLPKDFADRFFKHEQRNRKPPTARDLATKLDAARTDLAALEARHAEAQKAEAADAADAAKTKSAKDQKAIDKAQKKADEAAAALAALKSVATP